MKKIISLVVICLVAVGCLVGCGKNTPVGEWQFSHIEVEVSSLATQNGENYYNAINYLSFYANTIEDASTVQDYADEIRFATTKEEREKILKKAVDYINNNMDWDSAATVTFDDSGYFNGGTGFYPYTVSTVNNKMVSVTVDYPYGDPITFECDDTDKNKMYINELYCDDTALFIKTFKRINS